MSHTINISLSLTACPSSARIPISFTRSTTNAVLLHNLVSDASSIPLNNLKIIFRGKVIPKDGEMNVAEIFLLEDGCVIHCMGKPIQSESTTVATSVTSSPSLVRPPPSNIIPAPATPNATIPTTSEAVHPLEAALGTMKSNHDSASYTTGITTLIKLLDNIIAHPMEEKYRKVKRTNPAFQKRLGRLDGCTSAMISIGFTLEDQGATEEGVQEYVLIPSAEGWPKLLECKRILDNAKSDALCTSGFGTNVSGTAQANAGTEMGINMPGMPGGGMGGTNIEQSMSAMLQNPAQFQYLMQSPMIQQMFQNSPLVANNPMARQSLDMYTQNPQIMQSLIQEMSRNPEMLRRVQAASSGANLDMDNMRRQMEAMQQMNNIGSAGAVPPQQQNPEMNNSNAGGNNASISGLNGNQDEDSEMTEEEMMAEAIARSLREN